MTAGRIIIAVALLGLLAAAAGFAIRSWSGMADIELSLHGVIAASLGIFFSLLIGCGLMALLFISARHGFDEAADQALENTELGEAPADKDGADQQR